MMNKYDKFSRILHWLTVALVVIMLTLGCTWAFTHNYTVMWFHKSFGITLLLVMIVRLIWRLTKMHRPKYTITIARPRLFIAKSVHILLYICLFVMPLSGWLSSSFSHYPVPFWGLDVSLPLPKNSTASFILWKTHIYTIYVLITAIVLHLAGNTHHFIRKEKVIERML